MDEFEVNGLRRMAINAIKSKDKYLDQTGVQSVSKLGEQLLKILDAYYLK